MKIILFFRQDATDHLNIILYVDSFEKQIVDSFLTDVIFKIKGLNVDMDSIKITSIPGKTRNTF